MADILQEDSSVAVIGRFASRLHVHPPVTPHFAVMKHVLAGDTEVWRGLGLRVSL